jgi:hypothetical protein
MWWSKDVVPRWLLTLLSSSWPRSSGSCAARPRAFGAFQLWTAAAAHGFDASRFRAANASGDFETMESQARKAVNDRALIGLSPRQVRRELGEPSRTGRRRQLYVWHLGMINDFLGPGDDGALYVEFDRSWRRVVSAQVDTDVD